MRRSASRARPAGHGQHRLDDALVPGASAEVSRNRDADVLFRRIRAILQKLEQRGHHARRTEATLKAMVIAQRLLQWMQLGRRRSDALDGDYVASARLHGKHEAGTRRAPVD